MDAISLDPNTVAEQTEVNPEMVVAQDQKERAEREDARKILELIRQKQTTPPPPPGPLGANSLPAPGISFDTAEEIALFDKARKIDSLSFPPHGVYTLNGEQAEILAKSIENKYPSLVNNNNNAPQEEIKKPLDPLKVGNLGPVLIDAAKKVYAQRSAEVDKKTASINEINDKMEKLIKVLQVINKQQTNPPKEIRFDATHDDIFLFDQARVIDPIGFPAPGNYTFSPDEAKNLVDSIRTKLQLLTQQIQPLTAEMTEALEARKSAIETFNKLMTRFIQLIDDIIRRSRL